MTAATLALTPARLAAGGLVVAYCRISSDRAGAGIGVGRQEAEIRRTAAAMGLRVDVVLTDNDTSAYRGKPRPGYAELLDLLADGAVSKILVWHTDRLHRRMTELVSFVDALADSGATVHSVTAGPLDLATPAGVLSAHVFGAIAQHESAHKAERLRLMHEAKAAAGQFHGGRRRFGYVKGMTALDEAEAAEIRDAAARVLAGESLRSVVADWNRRGVLTTGGKEWRAQNLGNMLRGTHLAGLRVHNGATTPAAWPAVLDAATHEALTRFLGNPARRVSPGGARVYALSGLVRCGVCDTPLHGRPTRNSGGPAYVCRNGQHVQAPTAKVENLVWARVVQRLSDVDASGVFVDPVDVDKANARAAERVTLNAARAAMPAQLGVLSPADYAAGLAAIDSRLAALDDEAVADDDAARLPARVLDGLTGHPYDVTLALFGALTDDRRRAVLTVLGTPVLGRASRRGTGLEFEPGRVTFRWADEG
jgi:site-specific DNA recombinase